MSLFGQMGRYYNLDVVGGSKKTLLDPKSEWEQLEQSIEDPVPYMDDTERLYREYYPRVNSKLVAVLERLVRAVALQFTLGGHSDPAGHIGSLSVVFSDFRNLRDDALGTKDYRRSVEILKQDQHNWVRRSEAQILKGKHPTRVVQRHEFVGEWPFRAEKVILECRNKLCTIVNIEGYAFAINGMASGHLKLPDPHAAGVAIIGRSVGPFIDMALALGEQEPVPPASMSKQVLARGKAILRSGVARSSQTKKGLSR